LIIRFDFLILFFTCSHSTRCNPGLHAWPNVTFYSIRAITEIWYVRERERERERRGWRTSRNDTRKTRMYRSLEILLRYITVCEELSTHNLFAKIKHDDQASPQDVAQFHGSPWNDASVAYFETSFTRRLCRHYNTTVTYWRDNKTRHYNTAAWFNKRSRENRRMLFPSNFSMKFLYFSYKVFIFLYLFYIAERKTYIFTRFIN